MEYNLRPLWNELLDIYDVFRRIADKYRLRYYVTGGTALGAVRHDGFIPWDDDFDIIMPREDYRVFFDKSVADLPEYLRGEDFHHPSGEYGFQEMFGKIYDTRTDVISKISQETNLVLLQGIYIDVIPIDGYPKATLPFYFWAFKRSVWRHRYSTSPFWKFFSFLLNCKGDEISFENWLRSYSFDVMPCAWDYNGRTNMVLARLMSPSFSFGKPAWHKFDRTEVPLPHDYDTFLHCIFGENYMQFPPESQRKPSHQLLK